MRRPDGIRDRSSVAVTTPADPIERAGDHLATRSDDRTVAVRHQIVLTAVQLISVGQVARHIAPSEIGGDTDDEQLALLRDVAQRRDPLVAVVPGRREEDVDPPLVHRHSGEWHVVLPADQRPHSHIADVDGRQDIVLPVGPDQSLGACRHQLAMATCEFATVVDVHDGVVQAAGAHSLGDSECDPDASGACGSNTGSRSGPSTSTAWALNRSYQSPSLIGTTPYPVGVARYEGLGEHHQISTRPSASATWAATSSSVATRSRNAGVAWMAATVNVPSVPGRGPTSPSRFDISPPLRLRRVRRGDPNTVLPTSRTTATNHGHLRVSARTAWSTLGIDDGGTV